MATEQPKDERMVEVARKLKEFLDANNAFINYSNLTETLYVSDRTLCDTEVGKYDIPEDQWNID